MPRGQPGARPAADFVKTHGGRDGVRTMRQNKRSGRRGYALLTMMVFISVLAMLGVGLFSLGSTSLRTSTRRKENAQAMHLAISGFDYTVMRLKSEPNYTGLQSTAIGPGTLAVTITTPSGWPDRRQVISTGTIIGSQHTVVRTVRATVDTGGFAPVFDLAVALSARTTATLGGNITIGSLPILHQGNVHSNHDLSLGGTSMLIDGAVTATGTITVSGSPTVTGGMTSGVAPMVFPAIDQNFKDRALVNGSTTGNVTVSDGRLIQGKINGNLTVNSPLGCRVTGVVWVTGTLSVDGPVTGTGTLLSDGVMTLDSSLSIPDDDVRSLAFITTSSDSNNAIDLGGNREFKGLLYAPNGCVKLHGNPELIGGIMADALTIQGNPVITRWSNFRGLAPQLPSYFQLKGYEEL